VVLGAAQGLHALAVVGAGLVDVVGNRGRAHEAHGLHIRVLEQRVNRHLVALHHVEHAIGQAGLLQQIGDQQRGRRVGRGRLEHKGVAAAMATGNIHMGTMTGKLNGVMPATTPSGWRRVQLSMPVDTWSV
jgi:hypothetical protein